MPSSSQVTGADVGDGWKYNHHTDARAARRRRPAQLGDGHEQEGPSTRRSGPDRHHDGPTSGIPAPARRLVMQRARETGKRRSVVRQEIAKLLIMSKSAEWTARRTRRAGAGPAQGRELKQKLVSSHAQAARVHLYHGRRRALERRDTRYGASSPKSWSPCRRAQSPAAPTPAQHLPSTCSDAQRTQRRHRQNRSARRAAQYLPISDRRRSSRARDTARDAEGAVNSSGRKIAPEADDAGWLRRFQGDDHAIVFGGTVEMNSGSPG